MIILKEEREGLTSIRRPTYIRNITPQRDSPISIKNLTLQGDSRNIRRDKEEKDFSSYQCYHCDKMRHIVKNCPTRREEYKKRNKKRHHAHVVEDDEPPTKMTKEEIENYVLFSALSGSMSPGEDTWLIDNGASF